MNKQDTSAISVCPAMKEQCTHTNHCIAFNKKKVRELLDNKVDMNKIYSRVIKVIAEMRDTMFDSEFGEIQKDRKNNMLFDHYFITPIGSKTIVGTFQCQIPPQARLEMQRKYIKVMSAFNKTLKRIRKLTVENKIELFNKLDGYFKMEKFTVPLPEILGLITKLTKNDQI